MTFHYKNVYIGETGLVAGPYEKKGPLHHFFDKSYDDLKMGEATWEDSESKILEESVDILLSKCHKTRFDIDLFISGDLLNQCTSSNYAASRLGIPYFGIYNACATSVEGLILASNMIDAGQINSCICSVSSHNNAAEKQFRYPVEYGGPKKKTTTFTTTGGASAYLSRLKSEIKVESATVGTVCDMGIKDVYNMGAVMAPACAEVLHQHLKDTSRTLDYYDMIYSGDLGIYGKDILKDYMKQEYLMDLKNYDDTACMIFDIEQQSVYAGGSGPACLPLVSYGYIFEKMKNKELKKVLLIATGALMSTTMVNEKHTIPAIAHAISLEAVE
jgi:stage V sporulation protein AD